MTIDTLPVATQSVIANSLPSDEPSIRNVFLVYCTRTQSKGTGFLLTNGVVISNEHVVRGSKDNEITIFLTNGKQYNIKKSIRDQKKDLAILVTEEPLQGGLKLDFSSYQTRQPVHTWGFPLSHYGPAPLLSVGYISGFHYDNMQRKRLIVNGAFNPGNSGGPLFKSDSDQVFGIVVAKWLIPLTIFQQTALEALKNNCSGVQFNATDEKGSLKNFSESQLVADLLNHYRIHAQVMIGVAIPAEDLSTFLQEQGLPLP